jgi:hypothetical protein
MMTTKRRMTTHMNNRRNYDELIAEVKEITKEGTNLE